MPSLLIVAGPPGAGKSTVSRVIVDRYEPSALIEGDAFFAFLQRGAIDPWKPEAHAQNQVVTRAVAAATGAYVRGGIATVYDGVVGPWFVDEFVAGCRLAEVDYVILLPDVERCVRQVLTRVDHGFTDEAATRHMHAQFMAGQIDPRHVLADPPDDIEEVADAILARRSAGELRYEAAT